MIKPKTNRTKIISIAISENFYTDLLEYSQSCKEEFNSFNDFCNCLLLFAYSMLLSNEKKKGVQNGIKAN